MICQPMHYGKYKHWKKVWMRIIFLSTVSILLSIDSVVFWALEHFHTYLNWDMSRDRSRYAYYAMYLANIDIIMRMVVFGIVKISYTTALLVIASKVQVALKKSREMNGKNNGGSLFIIVCSVPLINFFSYSIFEMVG